jgi:hypothetical protein
MLYSLWNTRILYLKCMVRKKGLANGYKKVKNVGKYFTQNTKCYHVHICNKTSFKFLYCCVLNKNQKCYCWRSLKFVFTIKNEKDDFATVFVHVVNKYTHIYQEKRLLFSLHLGEVQLVPIFIACKLQ